MRSRGDKITLQRRPCLAFIIARERGRGLTVGLTGVFCIGIDEEYTPIRHGRVGRELSEAPAGFMWGGKSDHNGFVHLDFKGRSHNGVTMAAPLISARIFRRFRFFFERLGTKRMPDVEKHPDADRRIGDIECWINIGAEMEV